MAEAASSLHAGCTATIGGLVGRADLNGKIAKLLHFDEAAGRWAVEVVGEKVRVKVANLTLRAAALAEAGDEGEDSGVYVNATLNGKTVAVDPGLLKKRFEAIVKKYKFDDGPKSDAIADFLTSGECTEVSDEIFAERFGTSIEDASSFLQWLNVGISFKEQYMDPHQEQADAMAEQRRADRRKKTGVV